MTHSLGDENEVSRGFNCEEREGRTNYETKMK